MKIMSMSKQSEHFLIILTIFNLILFPSDKHSQLPLSQQMILFTRINQSLRVQSSQSSNVSKIVIHHNPTNLIKEKLLLNCEDVWVQIKMLTDRIHSLLIYMNMHFTFEISLITVKVIDCEFGRTFCIFLDDSADNAARFAFTLNKSQNMVDVVGNNVSLVSKWGGWVVFPLIFVCFFFFSLEIALKLSGASCFCW